jgi:ABC-type lipoprotein release transport system permease subunit
MAESAFTSSSRPSHQSNRGLPLSLRLAAIAWRNLWRNRRRTWLTVAGIAFAVWLLVFARAMQDGTFGTMVDNGARLLPGHIQVQHLDYADAPHMEYTLSSQPILDALAATGDFEHLSERAQGFALVSAGEKSFGAQVIGIQPGIEQQWSTLAAGTMQGRFLANPGEAFIGSILARNIGVGVGDELVVLGTAKQGGVAALALDVVGVVTSSITELDRSILLVDIGDFREAWGLDPDEAHAIVGIGKTLTRSENGLAAAAANDSTHSYRNWRDQMPEAEQMWNMKIITTEGMFYIIAIVVGFSVINSFMMLVFERTPEMGMLMAIGMKPGYLLVQLQAEALLVALLGIVTGTLLAMAIILPLNSIGIPYPLEGVEGIMQTMTIPERLHPRFDTHPLYVASLIMIVGTQVAALIPGSRIYRLRPVEAIRQEA